MINLTRGKSLYQLIAVPQQLLCLRLVGMKFGLFLFDGLIALVKYLVIRCSAVYLNPNMAYDNILIGEGYTDQSYKKNVCICITGLSFSSVFLFVENACELYLIMRIGNGTIGFFVLPLHNMGIIQGLPMDCDLFIILSPTYLGPTYCK